jgi:ketosteroid isomerase-like protein
MDAATKKLFAGYEKAFDALDIEKQVDFFAETFISAGPRGTIAQGRDEFMKMSREVAGYYRSVGQTGAKILSMKETAISGEYSFVTVHWGATFRKLGDKPVEFDVTYVIQKTDPAKPRIIMFVTHQDEEAVMKELGLLNQPAE